MKNQLYPKPSRRMSSEGTKRFVVVGISLLALMAGTSASGAGRVEATAGAFSDIKTGPLANTAFANDGSRVSNTSRTSTSVGGSVNNAFTDPGTPVISRTSSDYTVFGLVGSVPLTFHWEFSGNRLWDADNAAFGGTLSAGLDGPGFIANIGWSISYVDGPANQGDFAGVLTNPFGTSAAGSNYSFAFDPSTWNGQGTRTATTTITSASSGTAGTYSLLSDINFSGNVTANYGAVLAGVTVQDASQLLPGAHLLLDNGSQVPVTAIPEPSTGALYAILGLVVVASRRFGRRVTLES